MFLKTGKLSSPDMEDGRVRRYDDGIIQDGQNDENIEYRKSFKHMKISVMPDLIRLVSVPSILDILF